jgi:chaperonin GroEL
MEDAAVVMIDGKLNNVPAAGRLFQTLLEAGHKQVFLVCREIGDAVLSVMVVNHQRGAMKFLPVKMPVMETDKLAMFEDIGALTGARVLYVGDDGSQTANFTLDMAGGARRVWSEATQFGIIAGKGSPKALREHLRSLKVNLIEGKGKDKDKPEDQRVDALRRRVARLMGGTCVLSIGAPTEAEQKARQQIAERCVRALYAIARGGVVPGGGAAFLACQDAVRALDLPDEDTRAGAASVAQALDTLMLTIAHNAGANPTATVARARQAGKGMGLDALTGQITDMRTAGIVDSAEVLEHVLAAAGSVAGTAVTTDVLIRKRKPQEAMTP